MFRKMSRSLNNFRTKCLLFSKMYIYSYFRREILLVFSAVITICIYMYICKHICNGMSLQSFFYVWHFSIFCGCGYNNAQPAKFGKGHFLGMASLRNASSYYQNSKLKTRPRQRPNYELLLATIIYLIPKFKN